MHSQTFLSDGLRSPEELYAFARQEAFLDVFALADHTEMITPRQWEYMVGVTNDCNDPGRFVTLVGLEWTNSRLGHRNLHFPGDSAPFVRCNDPAFDDLEKLYRAARQEGAIVVPHHSANVTMGVDWSLGHDPEVERLVEIYSVWGNSERLATAGNHQPITVLGGEKPGQHVQDALARGYRYGFMGGGDIHDGRPGDELHNRQVQPQDYHDLYRQGIAGIWAKSLTREDVFDALWNRRVFATTNVRTIVRFTVGEARDLHLDVHGALPLTRVEIVRNSEDIVTLAPEGQDFSYEGQDAPRDGTDCYYARVTHEGGEMAWSSPVWVGP
ncbi:MAG: CehA/McbA family metallohydrolase [Armatimonadetes bacterium]|nr:CehA/McbA family metallohydrolase [Armatimonadota bacterium]